MSIPTAPQITIVGAGIAGLVLGKCLLKRGIIPTILEKATPSPRRNNYAITLYSNSYTPLLKILGLDENAFRTRVGVNAGAKEEKGDSLSFRANRARFEGLLAEGLDVQWGREVGGVQSGVLTLDNGERVEGEIVVGADGPHSVMRKAVAPEAEMKVLPFAVYNGKRRVSKEKLERMGWRGENVVEHRLGRSVFQVSVNDVDDDGDEVSLSYIYSRPARNGGSGDDPLYRPTRSKSSAKDIPDALFEEIDTLHGSLPPGLFQQIFHADAMRHDRLLNWLMRSMCFDDGAEVDLQKAADTQSIVLIGDAAHAEPILGPSYGANEAIEDSIALADFLADAAETRRRPLWEFYQGRVETWRHAVEQSEFRIQEMHAKASGSL